MYPFYSLAVNSWLRLSILLFLTVSLTDVPAQKISAESEMKMDPAGHQFVVMELFTSQGCSSCPPADAVLAQYVAAGNKQIIPLAFHVDYWDRLGWVDPFSQHVYSQRQEWYGNRISRNGIYTPQLVINGRYELIGSNRPAIESLVQKELTEKKPGTLQLTQLSLEKDAIYFRYRSINPNGLLNIALVEKKATTFIRSGENAGITLGNNNIVRVFQSQRQQVNGEGRIILPRDFHADAYALVLYTQGENNTGISSALYTDLVLLR